MYGCQLWFQSKQVMLVKKLQTVQNEAVRIIVGAFCTAPHEPLHQLLFILPMDLWLTMLRQNTAIRLYRVSKESQLLSRLRGDWAHTALQTLAEWATPNSLHLDHFPDLPPEAPTWNGKADWDYPQAANAITNLCKEGQAITIYCKGTVLSNLWEDGKQVEATSAVLYHNSQEWKHKEEVFGETVTSNNTTIHPPLPALEIITDFLASYQTTTQQNLLVITPSMLATNKVLDARPYEEQPISLDCLQKLGYFGSPDPSPLSASGG
ncbi:hypothetical protein BJV74DRAFT_799508 [Russula compacta]|nr:hypothetical protein BJV74DRAFT_799508 [Russula compacta]